MLRFFRSMFRKNTPVQPAFSSVSDFLKSNPRYRFRSLAAIQKATGLSAEAIREQATLPVYGFRRNRREAESYCLTE